MAIDPKIFDPFVSWYAGSDLLFECVVRASVDVKFRGNYPRNFSSGFLTLQPQGLVARRHPAYRVMSGTFFVNIFTPPTTVSIKQNDNDVFVIVHASFLTAMADKTEIVGSFTDDSISMRIPASDIYDQIFLTLTKERLVNFPTSPNFSLPGSISVIPPVIVKPKPGPPHHKSLKAKKASAA